MKTTFACAAAIAALLAATGANAQDADISFNVGVVSDYVYRGFTQSDENAAIQGGVDLEMGGFYAGTWASTVDFGDDTDAEIDLYAGYRGEAGSFSYDVGAIAYLYVGEPSGADYDFVEFKAALSHPVGTGSLGAAVYYSPEFFGGIGDATYVEANGSFPLTEAVSLSGALGYQDFESISGYTTWNLGATWALTDTFGLDFRYHDSDEDTPLSDSRFAVGLKAAF